MNPYQAWIKMGHTDDPKDLERCKNCKMSYELFTAPQMMLSCSDYKEEQEILAKKLQDDLEDRRRPPWIGYM